MTLDSAMKHFTKRLQSKGPIWIHTKDKIAFNAIIEYLNIKQERTFTNNLHFANLYAHSLGQFIEKFHTTIDDPIPHRELHKLMDTSFEYIVQDITQKMNNRLRVSILKQAGCTFEHPATVPQKKKELLLKKLNEQLQIDCNKQIFIGNAWSEEEVSQGIKSQLNQFYLCHTKN